MFGLRYFGEFRSQFKEIFWRIEIHERNYEGQTEELAMCGESPLNIVWEKRGDEFYTPVKGSEATVKITCEDHNFKYLGLFTSDPRRFRVSIYRNTKLFWRGFIVSDLYSESFSQPPYPISIRAIDGFSLLSNIPYPRPSADGLISFWSIVSECISLLELDTNVADWLDMYTDQMNEDISPLTQVYVDSEKLFSVYQEPTCRDLLELALSPFAAQIFQSSGAIHIRRLMSLYNDARPLSYYNTGSEFPTGWLRTADDRVIVTADGHPIATTFTRDRIESMWDSTINVLSSSTLEVIPPAKKVVVKVKNKLLDDILYRIGVYKRGKWSDPTLPGFYPYESKNGNSITLGLPGSFPSIGHIFYHNGIFVDKTSGILKFEATVESHINTDSMESTSVVYGFKLSTSRGDKWVDSDGNWVDEETHIERSVMRNTSTNEKIDIKGIPENGTLKFFIKQTVFFGDNGLGDKLLESLIYKDMKLYFTNEEIDSPVYTQDVDLRNNVDYEIDLPISDIDNIPNAELIYSLFPVHADKSPTKLWHTKGNADYLPLHKHIISSALLLRQKPRKMISATMDSGKHIDMNTLISDDKYLNTAFYMNAIELNALEDEHVNELVELPDAIGSVDLPDGENCLTLENLPFGVDAAVRCGSSILLKTSGSKLYVYNHVAKTLKFVCDTLLYVGIFEGDDAAILITSGKITVINPLGEIVSEKTFTVPVVAATYQLGKIYAVRKPAEVADTFLLTVYNRVNYDLTDSPQTATRVSAESFVSLRKDFYTIGLNFKSLPGQIRDYRNSYVYDTRVDQNCELSAIGYRNQIINGDAAILCLSDYFIAVDYANYGLALYRRDGLAISDAAEIYTEATAHYMFADSTPACIAYADGNHCHVLTIKGMKKTTDTGSGMVKGVFFISGDLIVVRNNKIDKFFYNK